VTVTILRTDGREETHQLPCEGIWPRLYSLLDAHSIDTFNLRDGQVMLVDDDGYVKPVNLKATALYQDVYRPTTMHEIVGDVALAQEADFA
jgi:hypothetical protein